MRSKVSIQTTGTGEESIAVQCRMLDISKKQRLRGNNNEVSISGLHSPHGTGMQAVSNVVETQETPPFQQVLSFFPFLIYFVF